MKELEIIRTQFDGGMVNDPRNTRTDVCRICTNFDIFTDKNRLIPYRDSESGDNASTTSQKGNFCIALRSGTTYRLYGLGVQSGNAKAEILMKNLTTGGTADLSDAGWDTPANNQSSGGATAFDLFVYYKKQGYIFGAEGGNRIWSFDPSSVAAWDTVGHGLSYTTICQGLVHTKNDILFIPYDNKIAKNDNGSWTDAALTLPSHLKVTSICEDGNFLVISAAPISGFGLSYVFKWDMSAVSWNEMIPAGEGSLMFVENLDGYIVGGILSGNNSSRNKSKIHLCYFNSAGPVTIQEFTSQTAAAGVRSFKQKADKRVYFLASITLNGSLREGVWSIGRTSSGGFAVAHERTPNNDTLTAGAYAFFLVGEFMFIAYTNLSANAALSKTNDSESFTATAILETVIYNSGDSSVTKKPLGVTIMTEPLPAAGSVAMEYKKDAETSFTEIFTSDTNDEISHSAVNIEAAGTNFPHEQEISFRLQSTGGAVITGYSFEPDFVDDGLY